MALFISLRNYLLHNHCAIHASKIILPVISRTKFHNSNLIKGRQCKISPKITSPIPQRTFNYSCHTFLEAFVEPYNASRTFSSSSKGNSFKFDERQESRRQKLLLLTYLSGFIGVCLLGAVGFRQYLTFARRAQGIEELRIREYGRNPHLYLYRGFVLPDFVINDVKRIHTFKVREDDIWVVSYPKSGTTWVQEIVYLVVTDGDFVTASKLNIEERFPYFEYMFPGKKTIDSMMSPRLIKSHLPISLLPNQITQKKPKIIYIARNPKDTVVSYYHFVVKFLSDVGQTFNGTFERYCQLFTEDQVHYGPWWKHVKEAWDRKDEENLLILFYEDMKLDPHKAVLDIAQFLGKPITKETVNAIVKHCSFESMKNNKSVNYDWMKEGELARKDASFMRKGEVGDWKNHLSADVVQKLDEIVATKLTLAGVPIRDSLPKTE